MNYFTLLQRLLYSIAYNFWTQCNLIFLLTTLLFFLNKYKVRRNTVFVKYLVHPSFFLSITFRCWYRSGKSKIKKKFLFLVPSYLCVCHHLPVASLSFIDSTYSYSGTSNNFVDIDTLNINLRLISVFFKMQ